MNPKTNHPSPMAGSLQRDREGSGERHAEQFVEYYNLGVSQAIQFTKLAVEASICVNTCAMDMARHMFWYPLGMEHWFTAANQSYAQWVEAMTQFAGAMMAPRDTATPKRSRFEREAMGEYRETPQSVEDGFDAAVASFDDEILA